MTDIELLKESIDELERISVPIGLTEPIGIPVYNVRQNLIDIFNSIQEKRAQAESDQNESGGEEK